MTHRAPRESDRGSGPSATVGDPLVAEAVRCLVDALRPEQIYLFGSRGRGDSREDSDYDFMVVVPDSDLPPHRRAQLAHLALRDVRLAADILVWTRQEFDRFLPVVGSLAATILREGRLLYAA
ncbi:MAG: nucleotidyltransferase domain-containing protein [Chloroflexi bacterium]|nr:nucleotidyltransferase domain-containing protein [Chloroflexota bacterium]